MIKAGPAGGIRGTNWEDTQCIKLVQIFVTHNDDFIQGLQFQYVENGKLLLSRLFGIRTACFSVVKLNYPNEYITSVGGSCDANNITSISFVTNIGTYGPFGMHSKNSTRFNFEIGKDNQFGGFYGSYSEGHIDSGITAIGVYIKLATVLSSIEKESSSTSNS